MKDEIIDVDIQPKSSALVTLGASPEDFAAALEAALNRLANLPRRELPPAPKIPVVLAGRQRLLGELATIRIRFGYHLFRKAPGCDDPGGA